MGILAMCSQLLLGFRIQHFYFGSIFYFTHDKKTMRTSYIFQRSQFLHQKMLILRHIIHHNFQQKIIISWNIKTFHNLRHCQNGFDKFFSHCQWMFFQSDVTKNHQFLSNFFPVDQRNIFFNYSLFFQSPDNLYY